MRSAEMRNTEDSNYNKVIESWREKFLTMDQEDIIQKFQLEADDRFIYIIYFARKLRIDRANGVIRYVDAPEEIPGFNTTMTIYNMFHYAIPCPVASGNLIPFRQVKRVYPFERAYQNTVLKRLQDTFAGHVEELKSACEKINGKELPQGDVGYVLPIFPFLDIAVLFWDKDEEFDAQGNMLFDSNITDFMHEEDVVCVAADAVQYLAREAGLLADQVFQG